MEAVLIIFMVLASIIGIGSTVIVTMTVVRESKERKAAAKADCDHCEKIPDCDSCDKVVNCDECDKIPDCDHCDKIPDCDSCDKVANCDECDKIPDCDHCDKIPDCDSCDKVANCDECDKIPDCDHCEKIPDCDSCDKVANCDECEYKKVVEEAVKAYVGKEKAYACAETTATERCVAEDVATEPDAEEAEVVKATESPEGNVAFSATRETIDERYLALPGEYKNYYDEIVKHAASIEKSKRYKNARYEEYKVGKNSLVRMLIKRGLVVCEFVIPNFDFRNYVNDNKVAIKQAPITLKVVDEEKLQIAKDTINIAVRAIEEEKEYKKEQARQKRRERARQAAAASEESEE